MKEKTRKLFEVNSDLIALLDILDDIGWKELRESSIHRILYLSSVLHVFLHRDQVLKPYENYSFSLSATGPYSDIIERSLIDLKRRDIITETESGYLNFVLKDSKVLKTFESDKQSWFRIIVYILGLYGESKVFGFVIQDPQYKDDFLRNTQTSINISDNNKTIETLNLFKKTFERTLAKASEIDDKEYLELYFEYVFSKIIKNE